LAVPVGTVITPSARPRGPDVRGHVKAFVRVAGRRWDLYLDNGVIIKLPEDNIDGALARLTRLDKDENLLQRAPAYAQVRGPIGKQPGRRHAGDLRLR